ncbi:MAG TPA: protein-export chaperone SecB [Stellaceae bacterium]|nr:protein-export chaperone SecB [Stellaceae bacterium]
MSDTAANGKSTALPSAHQNSGDQITGAAGETGPFFAVNVQFLKDFSFENPRAPNSLLPQNAPNEVQVGADVKAQKIGDDVYEVILNIKAEAKSQGEVAFLIELEYGAVVTIRNAPEDLVEMLLLVEAPTLLFPFARAIIATSTREGGFLPLLINPINFGEVRRLKQANLAAGEAGTA